MIHCLTETILVVSECVCICEIQIGFIFRKMDQNELAESNENDSLFPIHKELQ